MSESLYIDLAMCLVISVSGCVLWSYKMAILVERWKETIAVSVACAFIGFLFYLLLRLLVPVLGLSPHIWLTIPATILMVWVYYDIFLLRNLKQNERNNA